MKVPFPFYSVPLALIFLTACAPSRPNAISFATGNLSGHLEAAQADLIGKGGAIEHADPVGQALIHSASVDIGAAQLQAPIIEANIEKLGARATAAENGWANEKNHWAGYKLRMLGRITLILIGVGAFFAILLLAAGCGVISGIFGPMAGAGLFSRIINGLLTLGVNEAHAVGAWAGQAFSVGKKVIAQTQQSISIMPGGISGAPIASQGIAPLIPNAPGSQSLPLAT